MQSSYSIRQKTKKIFSIAFPIMIGMVVTQFQILTDSFFLGRINTEFFSAVGNVFFPFVISLAFIWSIPTGTTVIIAQKIGAGIGEQGGENAQASIKFNSMISFAMFLFWFFFSKPVFVLMGVKEPILTYCVDYVKFLSLSLIVGGVGTTTDAVFQGIGMTTPIMIAGILRSLLNIVLDWALIFGHLGLPAMGIKGAALATSLSDIIIVPLFLLYLLLYRKKPFHITFKGVVFSKWTYYREAIKIGLPTGLEDVLWNLGNLILVRFLNILGPIEAGIYTLVLRIEITPVFIYMGISKAAQTMVGNRTGEKNKVDAIKDGLLCTVYTLIISAVFVAVFLIIPGPVLRIFTKDGDFIGKTVPFLMLTSAYLIPKAVNITVGHSIRGYGDTKWMLQTQIFGTLFICGLAAIFMFPVGLGMYGLFIAMITDETVRAGINSVRFLKGFDWRLELFKRRQKGKNEPLSKEKDTVYT